MSVKDLTPGKWQPDSFAFSDENRTKADRIIAKYPAGRQASAVMPLLHLAQKQHGWLPARGDGLCWRYAGHAAH